MHSLKNTVLSCLFFYFLWKIPYCHAHIWSKNVNSVKTTLYYGPTKSIGCPFFPICHEKITALMPIFGQKNVHSLEKHTALMPIFCQKNVHSLKNTVLSCHFFFMKNSLRSCPYLVKITSILSKLPYIMGQKSQWQKKSKTFGHYIIDVVKIQ